MTIFKECFDLEVYKFLKLQYTITLRKIDFWKNKQFSFFLFFFATSHFFLSTSLYKYYKFFRIFTYQLSNIVLEVNKFKRLITVRDCLKNQFVNKYIYIREFKLKDNYHSNSTILHNLQFYLIFIFINR